MRCNDNGFGDGDLFFGTHRFLNAGPSDEGFNITIPTALIPANAVLTATDTEVSFGNTSEFSAGLVVAATDLLFSERLRLDSWLRATLLYPSTRYPQRGVRDG